MKSEALLKVVKSSKARILNEHEFGELDHTMNIERELFFVVDNNEYIIEWFVNLMTLKTPCGLEVKFNSVEHSGTWPNHFKMNLQFRYGKECVAILGTEKYKKD